MTRNALAQVLYEIDASKAAAPCDGGRLVVIDNQTGRTYDRKPRFTLGKNLRYFRVFSRSLAAEAPGPRCEIQGASFAERLELEMVYRARCPAGGEARLVANLCQGREGPGVALDRWLQRQLESFVQKQGSPSEVFQRFPQLISRLEQHLGQLADSELGLILQVQIRARGEVRPQRIDLNIDRLRVHARDADEVIEINVEVQLEVEDSAAVARHGAEGEEWQRLVSEAVRLFVAKDVSLHELIFHLRTRLRERLQQHLDQHLLVPAGRRLGFLRLEAQTATEVPPQHLREHYPVTCDIRGTVHKVEVSHVVQLELRDLGKLRIAGIDDINTWFSERIQAVTRSQMFEMTYRDLLVEFAPGQTIGAERLKLAMEEQVAQVGYSVQQLTTIPQLEPLRWKEGIALEIEETFATLDPRVEARLGIVVNGQINDIFAPVLSAYLDPEAASRLSEDIEKKVSAEVARHLHGMSPERVYMRLFRSDRSTEKPVADLLRQEIIELLSKDFAMEGVRVVIKPLESELTQRVEALMSRLHPLSVEVYPLRSQGQRDTVRLTTNVEVLGVHRQGWHVFRSRRFDSPEEEIAEIKRVLGEEIESTLATMPSEFLQYVDRGDHMTLQEVLDTTCETIAASFGLSIAFTGFKRAQTLSESQSVRVLTAEVEQETQLQIGAGQIRRDARLKQLQAQVDAERDLARDLTEELDLLRQRKAKLLADGIDPDDDDDELRAVQERIEAIRQQLPSSEIERRHDPLDHLDRCSNTTLNLADYGVDPSRRKKLGRGRRGSRSLPSAGENLG